MCAIVEVDEVNPLFLFDCVLFLLYVWISYNALILAVGVKHLRRNSQKKRKISQSCMESLPTISIIVPVKNEEKVMNRLLQALLKLDYPPKKEEIIIVEDGSEDKTVEICRKYAKHSNQIRLLRKPISNGKPFALNYALKHAKGEIIAVFDADNVPESDTLLKAVKYFEDSSTAAVQGRTCSINSEENMQTEFVSYEEAIWFTHVQGKDGLGLFVPLAGNCQFIRRDILKEVNGWNEDSLSEDVEMAAKLTERGFKIRYAPEILSWQEHPANIIQLVRQRARWYRGYMEATLKYGTLITKMNKRSIDAEITLLGPCMLILGLLGYLRTVYTLLFSIQLSPFSLIMAQIIPLLTLILLLAVGLALINVHAKKPRRVTNLLWLPFIYAFLTIESCIALYALIQIALKKPRSWTKTTKTGTYKGIEET